MSWILAQKLTIFDKQFRITSTPNANTGVHVLPFQSELILPTLNKLKIF